MGASNAQSGTVNFWSNPTALMAPDLAVQQQQLERRYQLAEALRQMSLQDDVPQRGAISPWQGVAKLAQALVANRLQSKADKQQVGLNTQLARQFAAHFRGGGSQPQYGGGPNPDGTMSLSSAPTTGDSAPTPAIPPQVGAVSAGTAQSSLPAPPAGAVPQSLTTAQVTMPPNGNNQQAGSTPDNSSLDNISQFGPNVGNAAPQPVQQPADTTGASRPGDWSYTGNPQTDMSLAIGLGMPEYLKMVGQAHMPTDFQKLMTARAEAAQRGDWNTVGTITQQITKQNYIAPVTARGGSWSIGADGSRTFNPQIPNGGEPVFDANGKLVGVKTMDGALKLIEDTQGAETKGRNRFEPITGYDSNRNPVFISKTDAATGGNGGGVRPGLRPGFGAAADVAGKNSAQVFQQISDMGADVPNRIYALQQMQGLVNDPKTILGPGSAEVARIKGIFGTLSQSVNIQPPDSVSNAAEFQKWAAQYSARTAQELGLSGSDARVQIAVHASPNGEMPKAALQAVIPQFMGMEMAKQGYANAAVAWQQTHGPDTAQQFRTTWNRVFDPRIYAWSAEGPQSLSQHMAGLSRADAIALRNKYLVLKQIGAVQ